MSTHESAYDAGAAGPGRRSRRAAVLTEPAPLGVSEGERGSLAAAATPAAVSPVEPDLAARIARVTEWLLLVVALGVVGAMIGWSLYKAHQALDATERDRLRGQARVVDDNVGQQLDGVNRALVSVRAEYLTTPLYGVSTLISMRLKALSDAIPGVRSMVLVDADGNVAASSVDMLIGRDFADRDYFRAARDGRGGETLHVAAPFHTSLGGYTVVFARAIRAPDGAFLGVVAAALEPQYFQVLLRSVLYAPDMWASLAHGDGKVFVTMPQDADRFRGNDEAAYAAIARAGRHDEATTTMVVGPLGGSAEPRLTALRAIAPASLQMDKPLVIAVSRSASELFAPWRDQALSYLTFFVLLSAGAAIGLHRGQYRRRSYALLQTSVARERRETAEQLELALKGADLGLWDWDVSRDHFNRNDTVVQQLGYGEGELGSDGPTWRALLHRDDSARLLAAIEDHCRRDTAAYECEYRVRHRDGRWVWLLSRGKVVERGASDQPLRMTGTHMDLTLRKLAEAKAERSAQLLRRTGQLAHIGGWELDLATTRLEWTEQVFLIHELDPGIALRLEETIEFFAPEARAAMLSAIEAGARDGQPWDLELPFVTARGHARWIRTQGVAVSEDGRPVRLLGAFQDITEKKLNALELQRLNEQLVRLSTIDALTQVGNRRLFDQTLKAEWQRAARHGGPVALLMIDVDHFKEYNDHYGHPAGDEVLRQMARLIGESVRRGGELVARYGGEEFVLLLPGADLEAARVVAERCQQGVADAKIEHRASATSAWVGVSIGVASQTASAAGDCQALVETADAALYRAKRCGRGRIEF
jgi:diguanylate cyclase (GGDEF)-like protein/PAS domain S-box-containing protein